MSAIEATLDLLLHKNTLAGFQRLRRAHHQYGVFRRQPDLSEAGAAEVTGHRSYIVKRLTSEPAAFFGLDVGTLELGDQADIVLIDPEALATGTDASKQS